MTVIGPWTEDHSCRGRSGHVHSRPLCHRLPPLTGKGCPSSYSNLADGGTYTQTLIKKFVAPNGLQYGDYSVVFHNSAGVKSTLPAREYRCY
ncbi:hypothetical protein Kpho02_57380 [Kitasatospora phosalacinea]|uniref:Uncharacterized protein n=1 Tax=Kitasatospora phosalacinea TaxID=2065 RepID=A0A9W6QC26_9ACTN|nr:hypothetical protein Kpho02_57380 [Kitasatospora phosalacinea]